VLVGLLLAFLLPAMAPWWLVDIASALAIVVGKISSAAWGATRCARPLSWAIVALS
jgi:electron transport complex protein RnfD